MTATRPRGRWGKAGQRLTDEQIRQRDADAGRRKLAATADDQAARDLWRHGQAGA